MLKIGTLKWKGRCKRHPKYDPVEGEGAVRGACAQCLALLEIYRHHRRLMEMMRAFGPVRERRSGKTRGADRQRSLFE